MRSKRISRALCVAGCCGLALSTSCHDPLSGLDSELAPDNVQVALEPGAPLDAAPRVLRLRIDLLASTPSFGVDALEMFEGELTSHYQGRIARGEMPEALLERRVPMLSWQVTPLTMLAQPTRVLGTERVYTLVAMGHRVLSKIVVDTDDSPILQRIWPAQESVGGDRGGIYCADAPIRLEPALVELAPDGVEASFTPSEVMPGSCGVLDVPWSAAKRVPPTKVNEVLFDPAPLVHPGADFEALAVPCDLGCVPLAPGCVCPQDDRATLVGPEQPAFFHFKLGEQIHSIETAQRSGAVLLGIAPDREHTVHGEAFDLHGRRIAVAAQFHTLAPRPHLALNEVYADANGPEPAQEWVELVNSGLVAVSLAGYVLKDVGGETELPPVTLGSHAYAVVVNAEYIADAELDLVPEPSATLIQVERLGKSGLSNSGELLRLSDPAGEVVSRFPAHPAPRSGVSVGRRAPWSLDSDGRSFGLHAPPGASPGAVNHLQPADD